jgi:hypothetical protein
VLLQRRGISWQLELLLVVLLLDNNRSNDDDSDDDDAMAILDRCHPSLDECRTSVRAVAFMVL